MVRSPVLRSLTLAFGVAAGGLLAQDAAAQPRNCIDTLAGLANYSRFVNAVTHASMVNYLHNLQNVTIFAPTDEAVNAAGAELVDRLFPRQTGQGGGREPDPVLAVAAIQTHVVQSRLPAAALAAGVHLNTLAGSQITTQPSSGGERGVTVTASPGVSARVVQADVPCANGIIQGIDRVLIR